MARFRRPRKSGPMIRVQVPVMAHEGDGYHTEHLVMGYSPYRGCVWAAVKPSWSKYWSVVHTDTGYIMRRAIKTADQAKVVVGRMDKYWRNCTWETLLEHNNQVQRDLYYTRDEYRIQNTEHPNLYWNVDTGRWVEPDEATVYSKEQKDMMNLTVGAWEMI